MKWISVLLASSLSLLANGLSYPIAKKVDQWDNYHGTLVYDPYRWLEDSNAPETREWIEAQNAVTHSFLEKIPARDKIKKRLTELWNYERYGTPFKRQNRYFVFRNDGLQNQSVLYTFDQLHGEHRVLLDPNQFSSDGTVALSGVAVTPDARYLAYGISASGSDWQEWKIRDVERGTDLPDHLKWIKFSGASWRRDGSGFYYSRYEEPEAGAAYRGVNHYHKVYFHKRGTPQSEDRLVYERPDQKEWNFSAYVTEDDRYLILTVHHGSNTKNRVFYKELSDENSPVVELLPLQDAAYDFIANEESLFYFQTDLEAPRGRVVAIDLSRPEKSSWKTIIPESEQTLNSVHLVNGQLIANYLQDAHSRIKIFLPDGSFARDVEIPGIGTISGFAGEKDQKETFYLFSSYTTPGTIYRYDLVSHRSELFRKPEVKFNPEDYKTEQVFVTSKDGTRVPMFLTYKKGMKKNGKNPVYLYGYGGFSISLTPSFSPGMLAWMEMGGIYAVANLRGGGEYGEEWHQAGTKDKKQNVFDDFISCAEWLIEKKFTHPKKLAIAGGSNGGLLVGACLSQRPELFGAALPAVGVMDMLRFHKFTIGWAWTSDYGSAENPEEFKSLYAYSPLHNLRRGESYPATLITTADHDDRVVPGHSFKFAAALQSAQAGPAPILIRIETKAGHGAGKPTSKVVEETADRFAFLHQVLKMPALK